MKLAGVFCLAALLLLIISLLVFPLPREKLEYCEASTMIMDRHGEILRPYMEGNDYLFRVGIDKINKHVINATIAAEDKRFYRHFGIDPFAVIRALWLNLKNRRIVSGGSTITMQLARLLEPKPRTFKAKLIEAFRALQLEMKFSKDEILEYYLNFAPYGGNLRGVETASSRYFGRHARDLILSEAALLAALPQSPSRYRPDRYPDRAMDRRNLVLRRMQKCGFIGTENLSEILSEPVSCSWNRFPFEAPHFADLARGTSLPGGRLVTTLDYKIQSIAETALIQAVENLRTEGVSNGALVIIDNNISSLRALVGSCEFFSEENSGQVNGALALRSPGSALKPFLYTAALDMGIISPTDVLADIPLDYSGYSPENYNRDCLGPVSVREALIKSLNIPAVKLSAKVGVDNLLKTLRKSGLSSLTQDKNYYGLSLTLGSAEVKLLELTNAYAAIARLGYYLPLKITQDDEKEQEKTGRRIFSEAASFIIADILSDPAMFDSPGTCSTDPCKPQIALKTGTSFGHRDAWAIGFNPEYTVGVWLGNFSGFPSRALVGISTSAPVVLRIFEKLYAGKTSPWYKMPDGVGTRTICALSGMPANSYCPNKKPGFYIKGASPYRKCNIHKRIMVDKISGLRLCRRSCHGRDYKLEVFEIWPPEIHTWLHAHGMLSKLPPPCFLECKSGKKERELHITSPVSDQQYVMVSEDRTGRLLFSADTAPGTEELYWFVNKNLYAKASPFEKTFWPAKRGNFKILCVDNAGRSSSISITIR